MILYDSSHETQLSIVEFRGWRYNENGTEDDLTDIACDGSFMEVLLMNGHHPQYLFSSPTACSVYNVSIF